MHVISTAKTTVLSEFNGLKTKSVYSHEKEQTTDFQIYAQQPIFLEVNKKSGLEIMRIKGTSSNDLEIQRVRKLNIEKMYCVACAKQNIEEMAFGGVNGQVSLYNYKNSTFLHRFKPGPEHNRSSVLYLDYNGTDEYIASVFENGQINVFGTMTKTKLETFNIDNYSTLARFHPIKRFHLAIASFKGSVNIYDLYSKRKTSNYLDAHAAPCRDLCMSALLPDTLVSVGYDCVVNIFDTRRKCQATQLKYDHPLSTGALSYCGNYLCVGDLKGSLISYDMRNLKQYLHIKKIHAEPVTRVAFVPQPANEANTPSFASPDEVESTCDARKSFVQTRPQRDSFCDFLDFQANKLDRFSTRLTSGRDSFDLETLVRKPFKDDIRTSLSAFSNSGNSVENNNPMSINLNDSSFENVNTRVRGKQTDDSKRQLSMSAVAPLRDRSNSIKLGGNLMLIEEEDQNSPTLDLLDDSCSDKENLQQVLELDQLQSSSTMANSTPNRQCLPMPVPDKRDHENANNEANAANNIGSTIDLARELDNLRLEMRTHFRQLESEIKYNAEENKWQIFTQAANLQAEKMRASEDIRDCLAAILQTDPFVVEFTRLKEENELLKAKLEECLQK